MVRASTHSKALANAAGAGLRKGNNPSAYVQLYHNTPALEILRICTMSVFVVIADDERRLI